MMTDLKLFVAGIVCIGALGCGDFGGGAAVVPSVTVLPADLSATSADAPNAAAGAGTAAVEPTATSGPGTFAGRVVLSGAVPGLPLLIVKGADVKDKEVCAAVDVPDERLVVGENNGVQNVFIYLKKAPKGSPKVAPPAEPMMFDQKNCRFVPHCLLVPTGQTVKVLSDDSVAHNTHTYPGRNSGMSVVVEPNDREGRVEVVYQRAETEPFSVKCDYHSWMSAYHLPLDHGYAAVTDENGAFEIADLPSGKHSFVVWHEAAAGKFIERSLTVTVNAGEVTQQDISYPVEKLEL